MTLRAGTSLEVSCSQRFRHATLQESHSQAMTNPFASHATDGVRGAKVCLLHGACNEEAAYLNDLDGILSVVYLSTADFNAFILTRHAVFPLSVPKRLSCSACAYQLHSEVGVASYHGHPNTNPHFYGYVSGDLPAPLARPSTTRLFLVTPAIPLTLACLLSVG